MIPLIHENKTPKPPKPMNVYKVRNKCKPVLKAK